eukprot:CAMPEP_0171121416 /NCGR_PEP_ID=MMETSP0766_2-20121228/102410_1 /TAXON_ID=439317 /ORGANISM="Gambierdiscus australes, Strain CAWD 149" /LENGTH=88 /DNA_ID=CAMNT_0011584201 /DNA_START=505 /DNA_END=768 /DNA_ORIENTATION=+
MFALALVHAPARAGAQTHVDGSQDAGNRKHAVTNGLIEHTKQASIDGNSFRGRQDQDPAWCLRTGEHGLDMRQRLAHPSEQAQGGREQ